MRPLTWCSRAASVNTIMVTAEVSASIRGHKKIKKLASTFHITDCTTMSPYPTVVIVTSPHHKLCGIDVKSVPIMSFSKKYTKYEPRNNVTKNNKNTALYSSK